MAKLESVFTAPEAREELVKLIEECQLAGSCKYTNRYIDTRHGQVFVACVNAENTDKEAIIILPGFRTCGIFWDMNKTMAALAEDNRVFIVDIIGQPGLSSGKVPPIKGPGYGEWLKELVEKLNLSKAIFVGASFGNLLIIKLAQVAPRLIERAVLMAPGGFTNIAKRVALSPSNSFYNLLLMLRPTPENISLFMNKLVLTPEHNMREEAWPFAIRYFEMALKHFKNGAEYPYRMPDKEIRMLTAPVHVILGKEDRFVDHKEVADRAQKLLPDLQSIDILEKHGHGVELSGVAIGKVRQYVSTREYSLPK